MSIYKPKRSPFWHYDFQWKGRRYHGSTGETKRSDAVAIEEAQKTRVRRGEFFPQKVEMSFDIAAGHYYEEVAKHQSSGDDSLYMAGNLAQRLGKNTLLSEIDDGKVTQYVSKRRGDYRARDKHDKRHVSPATVNREVELLRRIMYHAKTNHKVEIASVEWKKRKLKEPIRPVNPLSWAAQERLLDEAAPHLKDPIRFSLLTGLRLSNVMQLDWSQINMQARTMDFVIKGGRPHSLPISDELLVLLANLRPRERGPVFTRNGVKIKSWRSAWRGALKRAGISGFRWHDLRHTVGSRVTRTHGIAVAKEVLGHSDISTTQRYVHMDDEVKAAALDALAGPRNIPERKKQRG